jgi:hypothetical protein
MATTTKASAGSKTSTKAKTTATAAAKPKAAPKPKASIAAATVKKAPAKTAAPKTTKAVAPRKTATGTKAVRVAADRRRDYVEVAAYYIAERRNFVGGNAADDWKAAEAEIDRLLAEGKLTG